MGNGKSSPVDQRRREGSSTSRSRSASGWQHDYAQSSFSQYARNYPVQNPSAVGTENPIHADQDRRGEPSTTQSRPASGWQQHGYDQSSYPQNAQNYPVEIPYPSGFPPDYSQYPSHAAANPSLESKISTQYEAPRSQVHVPKKKIERRYSRIADNYSSLEEVTEALARAGLESSNLIMGIDFTMSNQWTGKHSYNGKSLHHLGSGLNPYEQAISIIGKTMAAFDEDNLIPCFGFGDTSTHDQDVFSFYPDGKFCEGFEDVLMQYRKLVPNLKLSGPTSFAPIIEMAMTVVQQSRGQYHVLLIIADGQVTRSVDTEDGRLSPQEQRTVDAIVEASKFPLSIVLVGVGDGPWDTMKEFDDNIPAREFDNFQFVNFTGIMYKNATQLRKETEFALAALMEIPVQYKATLELNLLGQRNHKVPERIALSPPGLGGGAAFSTIPGRTHMIPSERRWEPSTEAAPSAPTAAYEQQTCPICFTNPRDMAFGCGHLTCRDCGRDLEVCPICRSAIQTRIKLY